MNNTPFLFPHAACRHVIRGAWPPTATRLHARTRKGADGWCVNPLAAAAAVPLPPPSPLKAMAKVKKGRR
jgi:hypothetical protein